MSELRLTRAEDELEWWFASGEAELGHHGQSYEPNFGAQFSGFELRFTKRRREQVGRYELVRATVKMLGPEKYEVASMIYSPRGWPEALHRAFIPRRHHDIAKHYTLAGLAMVSPIAVAARDAFYSRLLKKFEKAQMPPPERPTVADFLVSRAMSADNALRRQLLQECEEKRDDVLRRYEELLQVREAA